MCNYPQTLRGYRFICYDLSCGLPSEQLQTCPTIKISHFLVFNRKNRKSLYTNL